MKALAKRVQRAARKLRPFEQRMSLRPSTACAAAGRFQLRLAPQLGRIHPRIAPRMWNPAERPVLPGWVAWCGAGPSRPLVVILKEF